jgi:hypothetical protein
MLPSAVNDTMRDMMAQIRDVGDGVRDGTYTMTAPKITGGTITGAAITASSYNGTVGATTASTGAFTTITSTTGANFATSSGSVGIGTSSPTNKLQVTGGGLTVNGTSPAFTANAAIIDVSGSITRISAAGADNSTNGTMTFNTASANAGFFNERIRIDSSGNVGIGTSSPGYLLTLTKAGENYINTNNTTNSISSYIGCDTTGVAIQSAGAYPIKFLPNNTERMRIDSSGNLLVGTTTAVGKITLEYDGASVVGQNINDSANTNNSTLMQFLIQGTQVGTIKRVGTTSAVIYNTTSDYRLKTVTSAVTGQGERIDALKPIDYQWKENNSQSRGFLAHEFQTVYPNSVSGEKDAVDANGKPVYQAMQASTSEVIADLVAEIQSLRQRITTLENK